MEKFDSPVRGNILQMRSLRNEHNGSTACNDADPRPTLRNRVHRIYLTAPLDAQTWTEVQIAHSIGFSGGQLPSYVEGSSALDFPLIHDARLQDTPYNEVNNIKRLKFYH